MKKNALLLFSFVSFFLTTFFSSFKKAEQNTTRKWKTDTTVLPSFARAKDHQSKNTIQRSGLVTFTTGLDNDCFLLDSANRRGYLYIEASTDRYENKTRKRIPLNLSIVIDRSGSMAGEKMDFARKAAAGIVDGLTSEDFVSVVIYDEYIDIIQPGVPVVHKDSIKAKIGKIKPRNSTNLWGGSDSGYQQVKINYRKNQVNRVLLISDGNITAGIKIPLRIIAKVQEYKDIEGITISTFGVGPDYNETLMTAMAENGAGNYYFIDKAEKMAPMFDKELAGLLNAIAQNAELRITLPRGVSVEKLYPFKYALDKNEVVIKLRDLFSEDSKSLLLQFRLDDKAEKELTIQSRLTYTNIVDNREESLVSEHTLRPVKSSDAYLARFNKAVAEQVLLFAASENMETAMLLADKGAYEAARKFAEANGFFFKENAVYVNASPALQKMDSLRRLYAAGIKNAKHMTTDSIRMMQKRERAMNYQIRSKKQ